MKTKVMHIAACMVFVGLMTPSLSFAATKFSYGAWIPYWKKTAAIPEVIAHIDSLSVISPFSYEVRANGTIRDAMKLGDESWLSLMEIAGSEGKKVVPTFAWQDGASIYAVLSSSTARQAHIDAITGLVDENDFDGVDIDYENKTAETNSYFSKFLTALSKEMHTRKKTLSCTIEPRTPATSRFVKVPKTLEYANDFKVLNRVCDEVRIMAYGQGRIDLKLNKVKSVNDTLYSPIADKAWVEKVVNEALRTISRNKIVLGLANFGYRYEITKVDGVISYNNVQSLTYNDTLALASSTNSSLTRNNAGELGFTYTTSTLSSISTSTQTFATSTYFVTLSDAKAIQGNIALAKKYKLRGVMLFKIDGESDPALWKMVK